MDPSYELGFQSPISDIDSISSHKGCPAPNRPARSSHKCLSSQIGRKDEMEQDGAGKGEGWPWEKGQSIRQL